MPTYKAAPGTEVNGVDQQGNVWEAPVSFGKSGAVTVPDDQQDVVAALDGAVGAGAVKLSKEPPPTNGNLKEE